MQDTPDPFQSQARMLAQTRATNSTLAAAAHPELEAMPELETQMRATLDDFTQWQRTLVPMAQPTERRTFRRTVARQGRRLWRTMSFHRALISLRLAIVGARFLLFWPILWRAVLVIAGIIGLLYGVNWLITNFDLVRQLFAG